MIKESALLELIAAQLAELLELLGQMRTDVRETHTTMGRIEEHLRRIDEMRSAATSKAAKWGEPRQRAQALMGRRGRKGRTD